MITKPAKKTRKQKRTAWQKTRKFFNDVHLWAGLISGLVVILVCFSGTIYTYNTELTEWAASHLHKVDVPDAVERMDASQLLPTVAATAGGTVSSIHIPSDPTRTYRFTVRKEGEQSRFGTTYYVNPYTGELRGTSEEQSQTRTALFMRDMFSLHRWLLLDRIEEPIIGNLPNRTLGSYISGAATILFTLGVITGLVIWFPQKLRTWRLGLRIKWKAGWKRINHDLHNTLAFYSLILLFIMG
ncbi:MAG TPA: PepSY-associated TM helix domain-containing protein, partial [Parapedobacter sp.]|nr:PepSY-associated TM helix domain-containing protein [Parapedobacter sp.]